MIAATYTQGGGFKVIDVDRPEITDDEILVRVMASSICGTDIRIIKNGHRKLKDGQTVTLGHEFSGVVAASGSHVLGIPVGARVGVAPNIGCGHCDVCIRGMTNMCPKYQAFGITFDGAHSEYLRVPAAAILQGNVTILPDELDFKAASLIEPLSCVVNGIRSCRIGLAETVVVFGAGPIGLMHIMLANISGAGKVIAVDLHSHRLKSAKHVGADIIINTREEDPRERILYETHGQGADVVITAASVALLQEESLELLAPFGRVCFFGGLPAHQKVPLDTNLIHYKNLTATGVTGGSPYDYRTAMKLISSKRVPTETIISHVFCTDEMQQAFDMALGGEAMKVVIGAAA
jgi:threonine dehydrogenase-like Zn-dependent dehydrogenase